MYSKYTDYLSVLQQMLQNRSNSIELTKFTVQKTMTLYDEKKLKQLEMDLEGRLQHMKVLPFT